MPESVMRQFVDMLASEFGEVRDEIDALASQAFIRSASWAIGWLEDVFGLPQTPALTVGQRQDRLMAESLGPGTITLAKALAVAAAYTNGQVRLAVDGATVYVYFVSQYGVPANVDALQTQYDQLLPERLGLTFKFRYLLWDQLTATTRTWDQITADSLTWDQLLASDPGSL